MNQEEKMDAFVEYPYNSFLMVRLEFILILGNELEAKVLRIIEKYVHDERRRIYREAINSLSVAPAGIVEVTKEVSVAISYKTFMSDLFQSDMSENTLKRALRSLIEKRIISSSYNPRKKYVPPSYIIHQPVLQMYLSALKYPGYQKLMVSLFEGIKNLGHQELIPSGCQKLMASKIDTLEKSGALSSDEAGYQKLMASKIDTTLIYEEESNISSSSSYTAPRLPSEEEEEALSFSSQKTPPPKQEPPVWIEPPKQEPEWGTSEAVVRLFEQLRGSPYSPRTRAEELEAAATYLGLGYSRETTLRLWNSAMVDCYWRPGGWCTDRPLKIKTLAKGENAANTLGRLNSPPSKGVSNGHTPDPIPTRYPKKIFRAPSTTGAPS